NQWLEFTGPDTARFHYYHQTVFGTGGPIGSPTAPVMAAAGQGVDDLVKIDGKWYIKYRNVAPSREEEQDTPLSPPGERHESLPTLPASQRREGIAGSRPPLPQPSLLKGEGFQPTVALTILPGSRGGSPLGSASTYSMPLITSPQTVYCRSRKRASSKQMKNWLLALSGTCVRAIEQVPRTCGASLNSALRSGLSEPPIPVPVGSPPWAIKSGITRWNTT